MATLDDIYRPEGVAMLKPLAERLGAVVARLEGGVIVIYTGYGPAVELGRGATMKQAVDDVMHNAREHAAKKASATE